MSGVFSEDNLTIKGSLERIPAEYLAGIFQYNVVCKNKGYNPVTIVAQLGWVCYTDTREKREGGCV